MEGREMIAVLYQWRIVPGKEAQFAETWTIITAGLKEQGALGSTLFDGTDGTVFAIARWPDLATRQASSAKRADPENYNLMIEAIAEELQEHVLDERLNFWT
jgi:hypothetical protein